jgi:hypothetical protein
MKRASEPARNNLVVFQWRWVFGRLRGKGGFVRGGRANAESEKKESRTPVLDGSLYTLGI